MPSTATRRARPAIPTTTTPTHRYRTIWLSDIHLGSSGCQAPYLLDFLRHNESEYLYLVGDIIDGWQLRKGWYWPQAHNDVVQKMLRKARKGTQVIYMPGNHDEAARQFCDLAFGDIHVRGEAFHTTLAGKRLWIVHGDLFDGVIQHAKWLAYLGDTLYTLILLLNRWFNRVRSRLGFPYWSLSQYLKHQVKNAVNFISSVRARDDRRSAPPRLRRRGLRAHPQGRNPRHRRRAVLQRRRLGRKPVGARRDVSKANCRSIYWTVMRAPEVSAQKARATA